MRNVWRRARSILRQRRVAFCHGGGLCRGRLTSGAAPAEDGVAMHALLLASLLGRRHAGGRHARRSRLARPAPRHRPRLRRRSSPTCARRSCATAATAAGPRPSLATTWATTDARTLDLHAARRRALPRRQRRSTRTRWWRTSSDLRRARGFRGPGASAWGRSWSRSRSSGPTPPCWPRCPSPSSRCRARASSRAGIGAAGRHGPVPLVAGMRRGEVRAGGEPRATGAARRGWRGSSSAASPARTRCVRALLAGEVDVTSAVGQQRVGAPARPGGRGRARLADRPQHRVPLDQQRAPALGDARVRQALARAIDRAALVDGPARRPRRAGAQPAAAARSGATGRARKELVLDRAAARRLLAEAGLAGRLRHDAAGRRRAAALPARPAAPGRAHPGRPGASRHPRAAPQVATAWSDYLERARRAATTTSPCWAGRPTPPTPTTSSPRCSPPSRSAPPTAAATGARPWTRCSSRAAAGSDPGERAARLPRGAGALPAGHAVGPALPRVRLHRLPAGACSGLAVGADRPPAVRQGMEDADDRGPRRPHSSLLGAAAHRGRAAAKGSRAARDKLRARIEARGPRPRRRARRCRSRT